MTGFDDLMSSVREDRKQFDVYAPDDETAVANVLTAHNVDVERRSLPDGGPGPFLVVKEDGEFAGAIPFSELDGLLEPPLQRPPALEGVSDGYRVLFEALDGTVFTALGRRDLLAVTREIEERAFRVGSGTLRACFQSFDRFRPQVDVYRELAGDTDLDVHVYGTPNWEVPEIAGLTYHELDGGAARRYWVLALEAEAGTVTNALVAVEREAGYDGFWTDDPERTRDAMAVLEAI